MRRQNFSLIELLVVIGILGALVSLVLPGFSSATDDSREKVAIAEMREIQQAFRRFASDTRLENDKDAMEDIVKYGLWPLIKEEHPDSSATVSYNDYNTDTGIGRRGPYLQREGELVTISTTFGDDYEGVGQAEVSSGADTANIPVIRDPYGNHYRVICPEIASGDSDAEVKAKLKKMVLVYTGTNGNLNASNATADLDDNGDIKKSNDDVVIRLMPLASW
jgi:type II secretory pathway pseudopilin PulG